MAISERDFGRTGWRVSSIGFGAWAIGGSWGDVSESDAKDTLNAALDAGVTFIDTADVYGDGRSERIVRDVLADRTGGRPVVATKAGRRLDPHVAEGYSLEAIEAFVDRSLGNLGGAEHQIPPRLAEGSAGDDPRQSAGRDNGPLLIVGDHCGSHCLIDETRRVRAEPDADGDHAGGCTRVGERHRSRHPSTSLFQP